jgi:glycosyltransferase involved in cell wall biosynthesis
VEHIDKLKKKLLFVCYFWWDKQNANQIQSYRLIQELKQYYHVQVLYRAPTSFASSEEIGIKSPDLSKLDKYIYKLFPHIESFFSLDVLLWNIFAYKFCKSYSISFDKLLISFSPFYLHFLGVWLKKRTQAKYIAQFMDPLADNNYWTTSERIKKKLLRIEKSICEKADFILVYSKLISDRFASRYHADILKKIVLSNFCTDPDIQDNIGMKNKKITIIHAGNLYGHRNLKALNQMLLVLIKKHPLLSDILEIRFYGKIYDKIDQDVKLFHDIEIVKFYSPVTQKELFSEIAKADALLVIDGMDKENVFFPSKLCEYFSLKKIIFGISPEISVTRDILIDSGHFVFSADETDLFAEVISKLINNRNIYLNKADCNYYRKFLPGEVIKPIVARFEKT